MDTYRHFLRPLLFKLDAERAHNLACALLKRPSLGRLLFGGERAIESDRLQVNFGGLTFPNPVGLGAGFDKDCEMVNSLMHFGFGYIVAGSVMSHRRPGNPKPRMLRDPAQKALYSCMGLPSKGLDYAVRQLQRARRDSVPLIVNFNGERLKDYLKCFEVLQPLGDALEIVLVCPNRPKDAGDFMDPLVADRLLRAVLKHKKKPLFIKILGYRSEEARQKRMALVAQILKYDIDGITITPDSLVDEKRLSIGRGTLTGRPMFQQMIDVVKDVYRLTKGKCHIKASGGIFTAQDAFEAIAAGATTVEIVTSFFYEGWNVARNINRGLIDLLDEHHIKNVTALRGTGRHI